MTGRIHSPLCIALVGLVFVLAACNSPQAVPVAQVPAAPDATQTSDLTFSPIPPTPTLTPMLPTATVTPTLVPSTPTTVAQIPKGKIVGVLLSQETKSPISSRYFSFMLVTQADKLDEATCTIKSGNMIIAGRTSHTDADGKFNAPESAEKDISGPFDAYMFLGISKEQGCFTVRDQNGKPLLIHMSESNGVDLGQVFIPTK